MQPGTRVGRYEIVGEIGRGAMGAVYRARDPKLGRDVAVKMISAAFGGGDDRAEIGARFEREARVAARLHHPNVVGVYDAGSEGDALFLVMELVEGETLSHRLSRGDFPGIGEGLEIAAQAADALAAAHEAGVIHRDVKPGNLLITRNGRVKVSDFGVAKAIGEQTELTRTGMMVGSPAYMAPEQVKGMPLDGRSDLFSLGVVLFEMVLRRKPFPADTVTTLVYQILHEDPLQDVNLASSLPPGLADFLRWTLAKDREARIPDARTFAARARALAAAGPVETAPTAMLPRTPTQPMPVASTGRPPAVSVTATTPVSRSRAGLAFALAAGAVLAVVAAVLLLREPDLPAVGRAEPQPMVATPLEQPAAPTPEPAVTPRVEPTPAPLPTVVAAVRIAAAAVEPQPTAVAPAPYEPSAPQPTVVPPVADPPPPIAATFQTRRAAEFHVSPEETVISIDGRPIGTADDWDGMGGGKAYVFSGPGEHLVRLSLAGHRTAWIKVVVGPGAEDDVVDVDTELEESE